MTPAPPTPATAGTPVTPSVTKLPPTPTKTPDVQEPAALAGPVGPTPDPAADANLAALVGGSASAASNEPLLQFFASGHLPARLQPASLPFETLAKMLVITLPRNPERTVALRKLLEAKDCAVRALLYK